MLTLSPSVDDPNRTSGDALGCMGLFIQPKTGWCITRCRYPGKQLDSELTDPTRGTLEAVIPRRGRLCARPYNQAPARDRLPSNASETIEVGEAPNVATSIVCGTRSRVDEDPRPSAFSRAPRRKKDHHSRWSSPLR